jgi:hypothetical protein
MPAKNVGDLKYEPYDSGYIPEDDMRPRSRNIARRSRPKAKQSHRSKSTDSTETNAGSPPNINNPRLLKVVEDTMQTLFLPKLNALKRETEQSERGFTEADGSPLHVTSALADGLEGNEKEQDNKKKKKKKAGSSSRRLNRIRERDRDRFNREEKRRNRS